MADLKQFVYSYDADRNPEEPLGEFDDTVPVPNEGDVILRNGRSWKVKQVVKSEVNRPKRFNVYRIYLVEE